jgi:hypothetical protein
MARTTMLFTLGLMAAGLPLAAADARAPAAPPASLYCLSMEPMTGSHMAWVQCRTRADWAYYDIDVDQEWHENGVSIIPRP